MSAAVSSVGRFLALVRKSGLMEEKCLEEHLQRLGESAPLPEQPSALAARLVSEGVLSPFQAEQLLEGKWRGFLIGGKYKVLELLGSGGMGKVFLCEHANLRKLVALKVLPLENVDRPASLERFYREARATASLDHPNIVRCHDADRDGKVHFLVMEFVDGPSLDVLVSRGGPLAIHRAADHVRQAALGLQHAHEAGWVHRDVKPGNLVVDRHGTVKVLDLGLARILLDNRDQLTKQFDERTILGTADYLAPEQAMNSHEVDVRADVYSLGATLYFLLAGRAPFEGATLTEKLLWHQVKEPTPLRELRPEVPAGLEAVVRKMMAKAPADRYQAPREVAEVLAPWAEESTPPTGEEMPRRCPAVRALSKDSGIKPPSADALRPKAADVAPETAKSPISSAPTSVLERARRHWLVVAAGVAVLALCIGCLIAFLNRKTDGDGAQATQETIVSSKEVATPVSTGPKTIFVSHAPSPDLASKGTVVSSIHQALSQARPGDRVVLLENLKEVLLLNGSKLAKNLTLQADWPGDKVSLLPPAGLKRVECLLTLVNVEGWTLKGLTLDGDDDRARTLLTVQGHCPGLTLEDLTLRRFRQSAVTFSGCTGEAARPVVARRLRTATGKKATRVASVILEARGEDGVVKSNRHLLFTDCRFEGLVDSAVRVDGPLADVAFQRNRFLSWKSERDVAHPSDAFWWRGTEPAAVEGLTIASNTFCRFTNALHLPALPAGTIALRNNLLVEMEALVKVERSVDEAAAARTFAGSEGNVCRLGDCRKGQPLVKATPLSFESLSEEPKHDGRFLRYPADSPLARAGADGGPVGVPPE
jgi:eukaryotic-like serine/threonine-protein kinase